jgi:hypothetical protein
MQDPIFFSVDAINHSGIAKHTCVCRLAAASRIEGGAIERDRDLAIIELAQTDDARIEFEKTRIPIVESVGCGHGDILSCWLRKSKGNPQISRITQITNALGHELVFV